MTRPAHCIARLVALAASLGLLAACGSNEPAPATASGGTATPSITVEREALDGGVTVDDPSVSLQTRAVRRIPLDSLQASLGVVAGLDKNGQPIRWQREVAGSLKVYYYDGLDSGAQGFGDELGRPDYRYKTEEPTRSSAIYAKFMRDLSVSVCTQMAEHDQSRVPVSETLPASDRNLWRYAPVLRLATDEEITRNLQYLVLRFVAIKANADAPLVTNLRAVFDAGRASTGLDAGAEVAQIEGWRGICMALIESPMFHLD